MIGKSTMKMYTIKEISDLAGVTTRTLRYYDEIGLLPPAGIADNGYRQYDEENLLRLQQIMFFRELDVPLSEISAILDRPDFHLLDALENHRASLLGRARQLDALIRTVDNTIESLKGTRTINAKELFEGFDETKYTQEAQERWGSTPQYQQSQKKWAAYSAEEKKAIKEKGADLTRRMVGQKADISPDDAEIQKAIGEYYAYLNTYFYTCDVEFLRSLSAMWAADPRFARNYDAVRAGGAQFVREAVGIYCNNHPA